MRRQYEYREKVRKRKHLQKNARYKQALNQYEQNLTNINQGLMRSYSQGQVAVNRLRSKMLAQSEQALIKGMQKSKFGDLTASGRTGRSIKRVGVMERAALGRFYSAQASKLTDARDIIKESNVANRRKAEAAKGREFAKVWQAPMEEVPTPRPVYQNVGMAMFTDALSIGSSVMGIASGGWATGGLFNPG